MTKKWTILLLILFLFGCGEDNNAEANGLTRHEDISQEIEVNCDSLKNPEVWLVWGQSNSANHVNEKYAPVNGVYNFFNGKCYVGADPLLGATGTEGSVWTRLADKYINLNPDRDVLIVSVGYGGTAISQWWHPTSHLLMYLIDQHTQLVDAGFTVDRGLFHQGESDAALETEWTWYATMWQWMHNNIIDAGMHAPVHVAMASYCSGYWSHKVRYAQWWLGAYRDNVFYGPDTDNILTTYRYDMCHFNGVGADMHADMWLTSLGY